MTQIAEKLQKYVGKTVKLVSMDDAQAPPAGTKGRVDFIDDMGNIHVKWENGSSLSLIYGVDSFTVEE